MAMAPFIYRLQKVYELRERKKKQQELLVIEAVARVQAVETSISEKKNEIRLLRQNMLSSPHTLMSMHDEFIHGLNHDLDQLYVDLQEAKEHLARERELLIKAEAELEALEKHKEKTYEAWLEDEKRLDLKRLDEVASQRFFRNQLEELEREEIETLAEEEQVAFNAQEGQSS